MQSGRPDIPAFSSSHVSTVRSVTLFFMPSLLVSTLVQQMQLYIKAALHSTRLRLSIYFKISDIQYMRLVPSATGISSAVNYSASISAELIHLAKLQRSFQLK